MKPQRTDRWRLPLVTQVMGLVLVSLAAAIGVHTAIALLIPPPPPEFYRTSEVAAALRNPGQPIMTRTGRVITAKTLDKPTPDRSDPGRPYRLEKWLARDLANQLGLQEPQVRVNLPSTEAGAGRRYLHAMRTQMPPRPDGPPGADHFGVGHGPDDHPPPGAAPPFAGGPPNGMHPPDDHPPQEPPPGPPPSAMGGPPMDGPPHEHGHGPPGMFMMGRGALNDPFLIAPFVAESHPSADKWVRVKVEENGLFGDWRRRVLFGFAISLLVLAPVAYLFARWLAAPIAGFARAAERLGRDPGAPPLTLAGPTEVAVAAAAFNDMQERIRRYVQDRTAMIGAVAHDLRTPLTRLRFRIEQAPDDLRQKLAADLDEMEAMIASTMAFVKDASQTAQRQKLELRSLVETVALEMAETGLDISVDDGPSVVIEGDVLGLRRLVANLIDNAVKFGERARLRVDRVGGDAIIDVDDDGPGLAEQDRDRVFEPFVRTEPSRSRQTGGAGLGLAVVRSIARAHGGDAILINRDGGGLRARVTLPI